MSSVKLKHSSGNSMSIAAPATNPASDLELKLPATIGTANQYLKNSSTPGTLEFGAAVDSSITVTHQTSAISGATNYDFTLPANCFKVEFHGYDIATSGSGYPCFRLGTSAGIRDSSNTYIYCQAKIGNSTGGADESQTRFYISGHLAGGSSHNHWINFAVTRAGATDRWNMYSDCMVNNDNNMQISQGYCDLGGSALTTVRFYPDGTGFGDGYFTWSAYCTV